MTFRLVSVFVGAVVLAAASFAQDINLPAVEGRVERAPVIPVGVASASSELRSVMKHAFDAHGAYEVRGGGERTSFDFKLEQTGANQVKLLIQSGRPAQTLLTESFTGESLRHAGLLAIDRAIEKTAGLPGIFAGKLVFLSDRTGHSEVYSSDMLFGNIRQLTSDRSQCLQPDISPDGRTVLYTSYHRNGFPDIYKINLTNGQRDIYVSFRGTNTGAAWSPNGKKVAMILSGAGNAELYTTDASGKEMRRLTTTKGIEADPCWSPDGTRIAFASDEPGRPQIFEISASGSSMRRLPTNISRFCTEPAWNPRDPNLLAFTIRQGRDFELALYDFSKQRSATISQGPGDAMEGCWTRDGRHIIYTERTSKYRRLMLLDSVTGKSAPLYDMGWGNSFQADYVYPGAQRD